MQSRHFDSFNSILSSFLQDSLHNIHRCGEKKSDESTSSAVLCSIVHGWWRQQGVHPRSLRDVCFVPARIYFFLVITTVWRTCRSFFFRCFFVPRSRVPLQPSAGYYACVHVAKKQNHVKKCSWLRRGLPRGGVIMVTLIAWPWKVDTFLIWYSKARACPIYRSGIPNATPCLLFSFSVVGVRQSAPGIHAAHALALWYRKRVIK